MYPAASQRGEIGQVSERVDDQIEWSGEGWSDGRSTSQPKGGRKEIGGIGERRREGGKDRKGGQ